MDMGRDMQWKAELSRFFRRLHTCCTASGPCFASLLTRPVPSFGLSATTMLGFTALHDTGPIVVAKGFQHFMKLHAFLVT